MMQVKPENNPLRRGYSASSLREFYEQVELEQSRQVFTKEKIMEEICYFLRAHKIFENYYIEDTGDSEVLTCFLHGDNTAPPSPVLEDFKNDVLNNNWKSMGWQAFIDDNKTISITKIAM